MMAQIRLFVVQAARWLLVGAVLAGVAPMLAGQPPAEATGAAAQAPSPTDSSGPDVVWHTFLGGSGADHGHELARHSDGSLYVAGSSRASWGTPLGDYDDGGSDALVAKLDSDGGLLWHTFLGGTGWDVAGGIALDSGGNVLVAGYSTVSWGTDPVRDHSGANEIMVAKLDSDGGLLWHTFLGGPHGDEARDVAVDSDGNIYVAGYSYATWGDPLRDFTPGVGSGDWEDALVAKLDSDGGLLWHTFLGADKEDGAWGITLDGDNDPVVTGYSYATWGSPVRGFTPNPDPNRIRSDAFVAKLTAEGALTWHTFLGSQEEDAGYDLVEIFGTGYLVTGESHATWGTPLRSYQGGASDAFVAGLQSDGRLAWNTFLGGDGADVGTAIDIAGDGPAYVAGTSDASWGAPKRAFTLGTDYYGDPATDVFVADIDASGSLTWNTFLGGDNDDRLPDVVAGGSAHVASTSRAGWGDDPVRDHTASYDAVVAHLDTHSTGMLRVVKSLVPAADPGLFNLQIDGATDPDAADVGDGGDTGQETVDAVDHTVGETAGAGTTLDDYETTIVCRERGGAGAEVASSSDAGPLVVSVGEDDDIVCTITNTRKSADNLIQNPGFESGADPWLFYSNTAASFSTGQPGSGGDNAARVEINGWGSNVQLFQTGIALKPNTAYRVSFDAFSNTGHDVHLDILKNGPPYTNYGCSQVPFDLDTGWQSFQHEFTTAGFGQPVTDGRLRFWFPIGAQPGDVYWIDNVVLEETVSGLATSLEVLKEVQPDDGTAWLIDVAGASAFQDTVGDNGSTGAREVEPGVYTITESGTGSASLDDYNAAYACSIDGAPGPSGDGPQVTLTIAQGQRARCTFTNAPKGSRPNVVANPSFELGTSGWHFYTNGQATFTTGAPASSGAAAGLLNVVSPGTNTQLYQPGISLEPYTDYRLCFDAFSNSGNDLAVYLQKHTAPYGGYGVHDEVADLSSDWDTFCYEFNTSMLYAPASDGRLRFTPLGSGLYVIDNIVLEKASPGPATSLEIVADFSPDDVTECDISVEGPTAFWETLTGDDSTGARIVEPGDYAIDAEVKKPPDMYSPEMYDTAYVCTINGAAGPSGDGTHIDVSIALHEHVVCTFSHILLGATPNLIRNPGFEHGPSDWFFYTNGAGSFAASPPGYSDTAAARVDITSPGSNMQLFQSGIALKPDTRYRLTFSARATDGHDMQVYLHKNGPPYTNYGLSGRLLDLKEYWVNYVLSFGTSGFAEPVDDARLRFWFVGGAQAGDQYWIDDVELTEYTP